MVDANRVSPLETRMFAVDGISISPIGAHERIALRVDDAAIKAVEKAIGLILPKKPKTSIVKNGRVALWIGPDEWLVMGDDGTALSQALSGVKSNLFSAVDVSHRNTAIQLSGANTEKVLNSGCPQDLSIGAFPLKACTRTVFGKAEVILWRTGEQEIQVECWRSFSDYVWKFLVDAAKSA